MSKLGDVLKKVGGVVTGVASTLVKAVPIVGNIASSALSSISTKLLQSPTPIKDSAAALVASAPTGISTPIKQSSLQLQLSTPAAYIPPIASTPIKQSSYDLTGQATPVAPGTNSVVPSSASLVSMSKGAQPSKTIGDIVDSVTGSAKKLSTAAIIGIVAGVIALIGLLVLVFKKRRRR